MVFNYRLLLSDELHFLVAEHLESYTYFTERHLQAIWFEQKYFANLHTPDGKPIKVISPGIWNAESGPDFLKAHLIIGEKEFIGDIELHLQNGSWFQHGHHQDKRYDQVILHLSLWQPNIVRPTVTSQGREVVQAFLESHLTIPQNRITKLIDLDLYPYKKFVGSGRCSHTLFQNLSDDKIMDFFQRAAEWRLEQKSSYLESVFNTPQAQLGAGLARVLGYKNNAQSFLDLFRWLDRVDAVSADQLLALGMRACGFFAARYRTKWQDSQKYQELYSLVEDFKEVPKIPITLLKTRPLNHPIRRLVILAKMIALQHHTQIYEDSIALWQKSWRSIKTPRGWKQLFDQFQQLLGEYEDEYWNHHYTFETEKREQLIPLIGEDLRREMVVNVIFPLLHRHLLIENELQAIEAFRKLYRSVLGSSNSKIKYLVHRFFGDSIKGKLLKKAFSEQGAFQLHHDFCMHYEASCEGCPFVERYQTVSNF